MDWITVQTRLGAFTVAAEGGAVVRIGLPDAPGGRDLRTEADPTSAVRRRAGAAAADGPAVGPGRASGHVPRDTGPAPRDATPADRAGNLAVLHQAAAQVREYVEGRRRDFTFPVRFEGTAFQQAVWEGLRRIPPGQTRTYRDVAAAIGKPGAARAVGQANRANPLPLVVPCHRVVASDGGLGGYMGHWGPEGREGGLKAEFLRLEGADLAVRRPGPDDAPPS